MQKQARSNSSLAIADYFRAPVLACLGMLTGIDMMSTFSCPSKIRNKPGIRFSTEKWANDWISYNDSLWTIYLYGLKDHFLAMIRKFKKTLQNKKESELRDRFLKRFKEFGVMRAPPILQ